MTTRIILVAVPLALAASCKKGPPPGARATAEKPLVEVAVTQKGFEPDTIQADPGQTVTLRITRKVKETCADAVDVQGDPVRHTLPLDKPVDVNVTMPKTGEIAFACPMKMIHGAVVVSAR
jgi:plastocyanin domain-containing protein